MKVGIVFHKDPTGPPTRIDLVRLRAIAGGLIYRGIDTEIIAPVSRVHTIDGRVPVVPLEALSVYGRYSLIKTCYHQSIKLVVEYAGPVVSRIVRVVDARLPERDSALRDELLLCQSLIQERAQAVILNNTLNQERWEHLYGRKQLVEIIPTGCPSNIPLNSPNPFHTEKPVVLFLGSLAAPRMVDLINGLAKELRDECEIHVVGANKTEMYGAQKEIPLERDVFYHGEMPEPEIWRYIRYSSVGLALATGPHAFDNDLSKMFYYLRGGLPVVSEDTVCTNYLLEETSYGEIVPFNNLSVLGERVLKLVRNPPPVSKQKIMDYMALHHSWENRVEKLLQLLDRVISAKEAC